MSLITISSGDVCNYQESGTPSVIRLYANTQFTTSENIVIAKGSKQSPRFYQEIACSLVGDAIRSVSTSVYSTTDSNKPRASYTVVIYDSDGVALYTPYTNLRIPPTNATTTWNVLETYSAGRPRQYAEDTLSSTEILALFNEYTDLASKATDVIYGSTSLSEVQDVLADPIAVGDNDPRVNKINAGSSRYATFALAVDAAAALTGIKVLQISTAIIPSANKTVPTDVILEFENGGKLTPASGVTVTVQGEIRAKAQQIFSTASGGDVNIAAARFDVGYFEWYGITSGGDNTTALQKLITQRKGGNYEYATNIQLVQGTDYSHASPLNWNNVFQMTINGAGCGPYLINGFTYTGSGSASAHRMKSAIGLKFNGIGFKYTHASFTGYLIEGGHNSGSDGGYIYFDRCRIAGTSTAYSSKGLVCFNGTIISGFRNCNFEYGQLGYVGVRLLSDSFTFADGDVSVVDNTLTKAAHGLVTGEQVRFTTSGVLPAGLATGTTYFAIATTANTFKVASSYENSVAGTAVDITGASGGGTHTVYLQWQSVVNYIDGCTFNNCGVHIYNAGESLTVTNCTHEATARVGGLGGSYRQGDLRIYGSDGSSTYALTMNGFWAGDCVASASTYAAFDLKNVYGAVISSGFIDGVINLASGGQTTIVKFNVCEDVQFGEGMFCSNFDNAITFDTGPSYVDIKGRLGATVVTPQYVSGGTWVKGRGSGRTLATVFKGGATIQGQPLRSNASGWDIGDREYLGGNNRAAQLVGLDAGSGVPNGSAGIIPPWNTSGRPFYIYGWGTGTKTFANGDVSIADDWITIAAGHNLDTGNQVVFTTTDVLPTAQVFATGTPNGITAAMTYYVIRVDGTRIRVALSEADAIAGTYLNITAVSATGGTPHTMTFPVPIPCLQVDSSGVVSTVSYNAPILNGGAALGATSTEIDRFNDVSAYQESILAAGALSTTKVYSGLSLNAAGAVTLAVPPATMLGQQKIIEMVADTGDVTLSLANCEGGTAATTCTFNDVGDKLILIAGTSKWTIIKEFGVAMS